MATHIATILGESPPGSRYSLPLVPHGLLKSLFSLPPGAYPSCLYFNTECASTIPGRNPPTTLTVIVSRNAAVGAGGRIRTERPRRGAVQRPTPNSQASRRRSACENSCTNHECKGSLYAAHSHHDSSALVTGATARCISIPSPPPSSTLLDCVSSLARRTAASFVSTTTSVAPASRSGVTSSFEAART